MMKAEVAIEPPMLTQRWNDDSQRLQKKIS